jgi:hypothetical protein
LVILKALTKVVMPIAKKRLMANKKAVQRKSEKKLVKRLFILSPKEF